MPYASPMTGVVAAGTAALSKCRMTLVSIVSAFGVLIAASPALADEHCTLPGEEPDWIITDSFGPASGSINEGDDAFFLGDVPPLTRNDRVYRERWLSLTVQQAVIVLVISTSVPSMEVRDEGGAILQIRSLVEIEEVLGPGDEIRGTFTYRMEFDPPADGRYRFLLTSAERFQDLREYSITATVFSAKPICEETIEPEEEAAPDPDAPDFGDFNNPPVLGP